MVLQQVLVQVVVVVVVGVDTQHSKCTTTRINNMCQWQLQPQCRKLDLRYQLLRQL